MSDLSDRNDLNVLQYAPKPAPQPFARRLGRALPRVAHAIALVLILSGAVWFAAETFSHWDTAYPRGELTHDQRTAALLIACGFCTAATTVYAQSLVRR